MSPTRSRLLRVGLGLLVVAIVLWRPLSLWMSPAPDGTRIVLWHAQRGRERELLETLIRDFNAQHAHEVYVEPLAVPDLAFKDKLLRSIPRGGGPDLFIRPHDHLMEYVEGGIVQTLSESDLPRDLSFDATLLEGLSIREELRGIPLTYKALLQFYNTTLVPDGIADSRDLGALRARLPEGIYPLAYDATSLFFHSPFLLSKDRVLFDSDGQSTLFDGEARETFRLPGKLKAEGILPPDPSYNESVRLFEAGEAAALVNGPWYSPGGKLAERSEWQVRPLFAVDGSPSGSLVTIEALFLSKSTRHRAEALEAARFLAGAKSQFARYSELSLPPVSELGSLDEMTPREGAMGKRKVAVQREALRHGLVTPTSSAMSLLWNPASDILKASAAGRDVDEAIATARFTLDKMNRTAAPPKSTAPLGIGIAVAIALGTMLLIRRVHRDTNDPVATRARLLGAWGKVSVPYVLPGLLAILALVVVPVLVGAGMSLFVYERGEFTYAGLANFVDILLPPLERAFEARSFYFALGVTVLWTAVNVVLHVVLGVSLALLLRPHYVRFRTPFRLLFILPWAIPNYITALVWKGMFHAQVGAINKLLAPFGFEGFNWFDHFGTAFFANVVTNTWLGFPFMMVVTMGALSSIPPELEEAATLDGASRWLRFRTIVLPHIRPALLPSILLGSVWTFNMFNVVYLVSGGEPGSQTDILISEAYRWAFERGQRYGYAAAYSVLIFGFLLFYGRFTQLRPKETTS